MSFKLKKYIPKQVEHIAIQVSEENLEDVAAWVGGNARSLTALDGGIDHCIFFKNYSGVTERLNIGDYVLNPEDEVYLGYSKEDFEEVFEPAREN